MKKIFYLLIVLAPFASISQNDCIKEISTDPDNPVNSSLPNTAFPGESPVNSDGRYRNSFDWMNGLNIQLQNMSPNQNMVALDFPGNQYYSYIYGGQEMTIENGWELMLYNVGQFPDGSNMANGNFADIPYIALYNRFTGILRVFGVYGDGYIPTGISFKGVEISVSFDQPTVRVNGMLRLLNGGDIALDQNTSVVQTKALTFHPNQEAKWFSADLQLAFDPCVCYGESPTNLRLSFEFFEEYRLDLQGRSLTVQDNIADGLNVNLNNFLSNTNFSGSPTDDQIILYKVMEDFVQDYIDRMDKYNQDLIAIGEYNKEVERRLWVAKIFKFVVVQGGSMTVSALSGVGLLQPAINWAGNLLTPGDWDEKTKKEFIKNLQKEAAKLLGKEADSFIKKNLSKKENPDKPEPPMASFTEMVMGGTLTQATSIDGSRFYSPGWYGSAEPGSPNVTTPLEYPIYNNAVGHFALLNTPKLKAFKTDFSLLDSYNEEYLIEAPPMTGNYISRWKGYDSWNGNYQFQLEDDIYYALNDINVESHTVKLAVEVTARPTNASSIISNFFIDEQNSMNFESIDVDMDENYPIIVNNGKGFNNGKNYCTNFASSTCSYEQLDLPQNNYSKSSIKFSSPYFDIDAISPVVFTAGVVNDNFYVMANSPNFINANSDGYRLSDFKAKLKVIVEVVFKDLDENGDNITGTYMFTYDINDINWGTTPLVTNIPNSPVNYNDYQENLVLSTTVFDGSVIDGCQLVGSHYTCHGWEDVTITGDLSATNGYTVDIIGGTAVYVVGESSVDPNPEIVLSVQSLLDLSEPMPRADVEFIRSFCKGALGENFPSYLANQLPKEMLEQIEAAEDEGNNAFARNVQPLDLILYPVPASSVLNMQTTIDLTNAEITFLDMTGRELDLKVNERSGRWFEVNTSGLAEGLYRVVIESNEGRVTKSFTVTKNN